MPGYLVPDDVLSQDASNDFNEFASQLGDPTAPPPAPVPADRGDRIDAASAPAPTPASDGLSNPLASLPHPSQYEPGQTPADPMAGLPTPDQYQPGAPPAPAPTPTPNYAQVGEPSINGLGTTGIGTAAASQAPAAPSQFAIDSSSPEAFIRSIAPAAQAAAARLGVPAEALIGMAANETGYGRYVAGNNLFGIKGQGPAGSSNAATWEDYGNGPVQIRDNFRAYNDPSESFNDFADLIASSPRYKAALGQPSVAGFVQALKDGGYMTDPDYVGKIVSIASRYAPIIADANAQLPQSPVAATPADQADRNAAANRTSQFQLGLSYSDALAACGPAAALALANKYGDGNIPAQAVMDAARSNGLWDPSNGMHGVAAEQQLLDKMGVATKLETSVDWNHVRSDVAGGNPVVISTPGHYFVVDGVDPKTGALHVGTSGTDLKAGAEWMSPEQMQAIEGAASGALYIDNPHAQGPSVAEQAAQANHNGAVSDALGFMQGAQNALKPVNDFLSGAGQKKDQIQQSFGDFVGSLGNPLDTLGQTKDALGNIVTSGNPAGSAALEANRAALAEPNSQPQPESGFQPKTFDQLNAGDIGNVAKDIVTGAPFGQVEDPSQNRANLNAAIDKANPIPDVQVGPVTIPTHAITSGAAAVATDPLTYVAGPGIDSAVESLGSGAAHLAPELVEKIPAAIKWAAQQGLIGAGWGGIQAAETPNLTPEQAATDVAGGAAFALGGGLVGKGIGAIADRFGGRGVQPSSEAPSAPRVLSPEEQAQAQATYRAVAKATHPDVNPGMDGSEFARAAKAYANGDLDTLTKMASDLNLTVGPKDVASADANTSWFDGVKQAVSDFVAGHTPDFSGLSDLGKQVGAWVYRHADAPIEERSSALVLGSDLARAADAGSEAGVGHALVNLARIGQGIASDPADQFLPGAPSGIARHTPTSGGGGISPDEPGRPATAGGAEGQQPELRDITPADYPAAIQPNTPEARAFKAGWLRAQNNQGIRRLVETTQPALRDALQQGHDAALQARVTDFVDQQASKPATPQVTEPPAGTKYVLPSFVTGQQRGGSDSGQVPAAGGQASPTRETATPATASPTPSATQAAPTSSVEPSKPTQGYATAGRWANAQVRITPEGQISVKGTLKPVEGWEGDTATKTINLSDWQAARGDIGSQRRMLARAFATQLNGPLGTRGYGGGWDHIVDAARSAVNQAIEKRETGAAPVMAAPAAVSEAPRTPSPAPASSVEPISPEPGKPPLTKTPEYVGTAARRLRQIADEWEQARNPRDVQSARASAYAALDAIHQEMPEIVRVRPVVNRMPNTPDHVRNIAKQVDSAASIYAKHTPTTGPQPAHAPVGTSQSDGTTLSPEQSHDVRSEPVQSAGANTERASERSAPRAGERAPRSAAGDRQPTRGKGGTRNPAAGTEPLQERPRPTRSVGPGAARSPEQPHLEQGQNYRPTPEDLRRQEKTPAHQRFEANVDAIRRAKEIAAGRSVTEADRAAFARYSGMGDTAFNDAFPLSKAKNPSPRLVALGEQLKDLLGPSEYASLSRSRLNAHFTTPTVIKAMWDAIQRLGAGNLPRLNVLEPSAGVGRFLGMMPEDLADRANLTAIELDQMTAKMLEALYPNAQVLNMGFERTDADRPGSVPDNSQDIVISNVPFGNYPVADPAFKDRPELTRAIHNYFFAKALDKVRPGGVVAFITSHYTMDSTSDSVRRYLANRAVLLGAIRLPQDAFPDTAVTTDILFLRKLEQPRTGGPLPEWVHTQPFSGEHKGQTIEAQVNRYFLSERPEMALGEHGITGHNTDGVPGYALLKSNEGPSIEERLRDAVKQLPGNVLQPYEAPKGPSETTLAANKALEGSFVDQDGKLLSMVGGELKPAGRYVDRKDGKTWVPYTDAEQQRIRDMLAIHDFGRAVLDHQQQGHDERTIKLAQAHLKRAYDNFAKANGPLHLQSNRTLMRSDTRSYWLHALENWSDDLEKAFKGGRRAPTPAELGELRSDLFVRTDLAGPTKTVERASTPKDALAVTLNEMGRLDFQRMVELLGRPAAEIAADLHRDKLLYRNPDSKQWQLADEYLSGNVRDKLAQAEKAAASNPQDYAANVEALKAVIPADIAPGNIDVRLGTHWIPASDVNQFVRQTLFGPSYQADHYEPFQHIAGADTAMWKRNSHNDTYMLDRGKAAEFSTERRDPLQLIESAMNNQEVRIYFPSLPGEKRVLDEKATMAAQGAVRKLRAAFKNWLWSDPERAARLSRFYNDTYNSWRNREYDGSHLSFPGKSPNIDLRPLQKAVVWRGITSPTLLMAHEVGYGKSMSMAAAAMEKKRLGLERKPAFAVPNHLVGQMAREFWKLYPGANLLVPDKRDFEAGGRATLMSRIATGDWDGVILPVSQVKLLPVHPETALRFMENLKAELQAVINAYAAARSGRVDKDDRTYKDLQKRAASMDAQMQATRDRLKEYQQSHAHSLFWDDLGIDALYVDEADQFKNLPFFTTMPRIKGLPNAKSDRAFDMHMKTQLLLEKYGRGVTFATGTPISNTIAELWTMLRYLMPETLKDLDMSAFDAWASAFGEPVTAIEQTITGEWKPVTRFAKFGNVPELSALFQRVADIRMAEDSPDMEAKKPQMRGGRRIKVKSQQLDWHKQYVQYLLARARHLGPPEPGADNMLSITGDAKKASLDPTLVYTPKVDDKGEFVRNTDGVPIKSGVRGPEHPDGKITQLVDNVARIWERERADRGTQLVFLDLGTPKDGDADRAKLPAELKTEIAQAKARAAAEGDTFEDADEQEVIRRYYLDHNLGDPEEQASIDNVYGRIKQKLVARGIPEREIAFIHEARNDKERLALYDRVNAGQVRVLIGSTEKMGAGTNIQKRAAALHHLDTPWRPRDLEQREGRVLRPGNEVYGPPTDDKGNVLLDSSGKPRQGRGVEVYQYTTEWPFDAYLWSTLLAKIRAIKSMMRRNPTERNVLDADSHILDLQDLEALASGDPIAMKRRTVAEELRQIEAEERDHRNRQARSATEARDLPQQIAREKRLIEQAKTDAGIVGRAGDSFSVTIEGHKYDKRPEAGQALVDALQRFADSEAKSAHIGSFKGLPLFATSVGPSRWALALMNPKVPEDLARWATYSSSTIDSLSPQGLVTRLENLPKQIDVTGKQAEWNVREFTDRLRGAQSFVKRPFPESERIEQLRHAMDMIERRMSGEKKKDADGKDTAEPIFSDEQIDQALDGGPAAKDPNRQPEPNPAEQAQIADLEQQPEAAPDAASSEIASTNENEKSEAEPALVSESSDDENAPPRAKPAHRELPAMPPEGDGRIATLSELVGDSTDPKTLTRAFESMQTEISKLARAALLKPEYRGVKFLPGKPGIYRNTGILARFDGDDGKRIEVRLEPHGMAPEWQIAVREQGTDRWERQPGWGAFAHTIDMLGHILAHQGNVEFRWQPLEAIYTARLQLRQLEENGAGTFTGADSTALGPLRFPGGHEAAMAAVPLLKPSAGTEAPAAEAPKNVAATEAPTQAEGRAEPISAPTADAALAGSPDNSSRTPAYDYQSTQANLPGEMASKVERYQRGIDPTDLGPGGLESQPHVTLKYGLHSGVNADDVRRILDGQPPIRVTFGANAAFPADEDGAPLYVSVDSPDLHRLNGMLSAVLPHDQTHPEYTPHVTIAYLRPDAVDKYVGESSPLAGTSTTLGSIAFSDRDGNQIEIPLNGKARTNGRTNGHTAPIKTSETHTPSVAGSNGANGHGGNGKPPAPPSSPEPPTPSEPERQHVVGFGYQSGMSPEVADAVQTAADAFKPERISQADVARAAQVLGLDEKSARQLRDAALSDEQSVSVASQTLRYRARAAVEAVQHFDALHAQAAAKQAQGIELSQDEKESLDEATRSAVLAAAQMDLKASRRFTADVARALNQHKFTITAQSARQAYQRLDAAAAAVHEAAQVLEHANGRVLGPTEQAKVSVAAEQLEQMADAADAADAAEDRVSAAPTAAATSDQLVDNGLSRETADAIADRPLIEQKALDLVRLTPEWKAARAAGQWDRVNQIEQQRAALIHDMDSMLAAEEAERQAGPARETRERPPIDVEASAARGVLAKMRREIRDRLRDPDAGRDADLARINDQVRQLVLEQEVSGKDLLPKSARLAEMNRQQAQARDRGDYARASRIERERAKVLGELRDEIERQVREKIAKGPRTFTTGAELEQHVREAMGKGIIRQITRAIDAQLHPEREAGRIGEQVARRVRTELERERLRDLAHQLRDLGSSPFRQGTTARTIAGIHETIQQLEATSAAGKARASEIRRALVKAGLFRYLERRDVPEDRLNDLITMVMSADPERPEQIAHVLRALRQPSVWDKLREYTVINMLSAPLTWGLMGTSVLSHLIIGTGRILVATPLDALHDRARHGGANMSLGEVPAAIAGAKATIPESLRLYGQIMKQGFTPDAVQSAIELGDLGALRREYLSEGKRFGWFWQWMHRISTRPVEAAYASMGHVLYGAMTHSLAYREARKLLMSGERSDISTHDLQAEILRNIWDYPHIVKQAGAIEDYSLLRSKLDRVSSALSYLRHAPIGSSGLRQAGAFALHQLFPFMVVPINFTKMGTDTSALGTAVNAARYTGERDPFKQAALFRKVLVGSLLAAAGIGLLLADDLTGQGPSDPSKRRLWLDTHQTDSVRVMGNWVSYDGTYFAIPLSMLANAYESAQEASVKSGKAPTGDQFLNILAATLGGAARGVVEGIASERFLKTLGDFQGILSGNTSPSTFISSQLSKFVPLSSMLALFARMGDGLQRESHTVTEQIANRIPGLRQSSPPSLNPLGQPQPNDQQGLAALLPFHPATKPDQSNPVIAEYERLHVSLPTAPSHVHSVPLEDSERHDYEAEAGPIIEAAARKLIASKGYQKLQDPARAKVLQQIVTNVHEAEAAKALKRLGAAEIRRRLALAKPAA